MYIIHHMLYIIRAQTTSTNAMRADTRGDGAWGTCAEKAERMSTKRAASDGAA